MLLHSVGLCYKSAFIIIFVKDIYTIDTRDENTRCCIGALTAIQYNTPDNDKFEPGCLIHHSNIMCMKKKNHLSTFLSAETVNQRLGKQIALQSRWFCMQGYITCHEVHGREERGR